MILLFLMVGPRTGASQCMYMKQIWIPVIIGYSFSNNATMTLIPVLWKPRKKIML